jgi:hypothetical protein
MFHVLTVHFRDARWIEPQLRYLERNLKDDYRIWASLNGIDMAWADRFHWAEDMEGGHPTKLNNLAEIVRKEADPDDLLMFLDGDAFPIAPVTEAVLGGFPLAAVRRDENLGQCQPHPCFCVTSVRFWFDIGGDWRRGYTWIAANGEELSDAGGNLLGILTEKNIEWRPLLRSNKVDLDPLWFGIYDDLVYHHGAGFRPPLSALQHRPAAEAQRTSIDGAVVPASVPILGRAERSVRYRLAKRRIARELDALAAEGQELSDEVFSWIENDEEFYRRFI